MDYATKKGVSPYLTVVDADQESAGQVLFSYVNNYASGGFGVPWNLLLDGKSMEYVWSSTVGTGDLYGELEKLTLQCQEEADCFEGETCKKETEEDFKGVCQ